MVLNKQATTLDTLRRDYKNGNIPCLVDVSMRIFGGKWKSSILWILGTKEVLRFGELKKLLSNITPKMLTQQLRELEEFDMVIRTEHYQIPPKVEYSLTDRGQSVIPLLETMCEWCDDNIINIE